MSSLIEWTEETLNPVVGCSKVSPGCDNCYAERVNKRTRPGVPFERVELKPGRLNAPLRRRKPTTYFVNSMSDLFHDSVPDSFIAQVFAVMFAASEHTFQVLTKRPGRMASLLARDEWVDGLVETLAARHTHAAFTWPLPNVWLGVSVEDQKWADVRIPKLLRTPASVRFLSCEPLLGPINLHNWTVARDPDYPNYAPIDWVIVGGESGPGARPMDLNWARGLIDQCKDARVACFVKQLGAVWAREHTARKLDCGPADSKGGDMAHWSPLYRVREMPERQEATR